ncbi:MAG: hypothetical protein ACETWM_12930 [Candidatus Lokiarchaeia archaeon]
MSSKEIEHCERDLEDAENTARIGNFGKAARKYFDTVALCRKVGWDDEAMEALFLAYLYPCNQDAKDGKDLYETQSLRTFVQQTYKLPQMNVMAYMPGGLYGEFDTKRLLMEARGILYMELGRKAKTVEQAVKLLGSASDLFIEIGDSDLVFSRYVSCLKRRTTGNYAALECEGHIESIKGSVFIETDPSKAIGYIMAAARAYRAAKLHDVWKGMNKRIEALRATRKCWMCGREAQSTDNFQIVRASIGRYFENRLREMKEDMRVMDGKSSIVLCKPCYTAIYYEADRIARTWYDMAMQAIQTLEARIRRLERRR